MVDKFRKKGMRRRATKPYGPLAVENFDWDKQWVDASSQPPKSSLWFVGILMTLLGMMLMWPVAHFKLIKVIMFIGISKYN